jgi:hypothetical protein
VQTKAAGGYFVGSEDEEEREAGARELVEGLVDLLLGRLAVEVSDGQLGEVVAQQGNGVSAVDGFGADIST